MTYLALAAQRCRLMRSRAMKKNDPRWNDTRRIEGSGNVFVDLGFDPAKAEAMFREGARMMSKTGHLARFRLAESGQGRTRLRRTKRRGD